MKKFIYSALALISMGLCPAQLVSLTQAEYFWDTDPGEGNATAITAVDGNFNSAFEKIAIYGLGAPSTGLHKFCVRIKHNQNVWSPVFTNVVRVEPTLTTVPVSLTQAEYFWDTDPGEGNATPILATDGNFDSAYERVALAGLNAPSVGLHKFCMRVKDNQGIWAPTFTNIVKVEATTAPAPIQLVQAEYFWDTDPGEGSGTPFAAADGNYNSVYEKMLQNNIPLTGPVGLHVFNVRVKDNQGVWGPIFKNAIYIETVVLSNDDFNQSDVMVYPNPVRDILNISYEKEIATVAVFSILGQEVVTRKINATEGAIDFSNLAAGTYIVKVQSENKVKTLKVIKQ